MELTCKRKSDKIIGAAGNVPAALDDLGEDPGEGESWR